MCSVMNSGFEIINLEVKDAYCSCRCKLYMFEV